ncbi:NifB/NifX family molybdenum-iron cluster-binding protein [Methanocella sp. MCL-LM]|uniref:NifB/NifX family molybdenum-iron cluster-binding protein n=1 Tax=Methanocella sp. MCL-LM TaxID=3412035 RepID=UPI003C7913A1
MTPAIKVCIPKSDAKVFRHFGKAPEFAFFLIENGKVASTEIIPNPGREKGQVPHLIIEHQATHIVAAAIGPQAVTIFHEKGIEVYPDALGMLDTILERFLKGELKPAAKKSQMPCAGDNVCGVKTQ